MTNAGIDSGDTESTHYTYRVTVSFELQFTFTGDQLQPAEEGGEGDLEPTHQALKDLEDELGEYLGQNYAVDKVEAWADFDQLLNVGS